MMFARSFLLYLMQLLSIRSSADSLNHGSEQEQPADRSPDDALKALDRETARIRKNLKWEPRQVDAIYKLYARYVELGKPFPLDLEEKSLRIILQFIRPHDEQVAQRLWTVLERQGKPVSEELRALATVNSDAAPESLAKRQRELTADRNAATPEVAALHERLIFVMGIPKSASRLMVSAVAAMHPYEQFRRPTALPYTTGFVGYDLTTDLRIEKLSDFSGGGVVHSHAGATNTNCYTLARLGLGQIITVRHPADQLAALYCHIRRIARSNFKAKGVRRRLEVVAPSDPLTFVESYANESGVNNLYFHNVIFPVDFRFFAPGADIDDGITHMITAGYLYHALTWIVSWQLLRIRNTSIIVRYEDFIGAPNGTLRRVNRAIFNSDEEAALARGHKAVAGQAYEDSPDPEIYPRGSTGSCGIWKRYLSTRNRCLYNSVCQQFIASHPYGSLLLRLYDDLLIAEED